MRRRPAAAVEQVAWSLADVTPTPSVVTIGMFDGVHRGHQAIVGRAVTAGLEERLRSVAVTFDRHPAEVVRPGSQPTYLMTLERKVEVLLEQGVELVVVLPFTLERSRQSPDEFAAGVLAGPLAAQHVVVGANFRFGHKAAGDAPALTRLGHDLGFAAEAVRLLVRDGEAVSSTAIRERLATGDVAWAAAALGRPYELDGTVVRGDGRGRSIGVPTANLDVPEHIQVPGNGVYAGHAAVVGSAGAPSALRGDEPSQGARPAAPVPAVVNVGVRPTFGGGKVTVETHLLDVADARSGPARQPVTDDLYGRRLRLAFTARLRDERRFDNVDQLVAQIHSDIHDARAALAG